jgi:hypothetical protein
VSSAVATFNGSSAKGLVLNGVPVNGHTPANGAPLDIPASTPNSPAVSWSPPEAEFNAREQARLEKGIAEANERADRARARARERDGELEALVEAEMLATDQALDTMRLDHEREIARIRERARTEVENMLDEARRRAEALRAETDHE